MSAVASNNYSPPGLFPDAESDIQRVFDLQRDSALRLRTSTVAERIAKLKRFRAAVMAHSEAIIDAGAKDFSRSAIEVEFTELMPVIGEISDTCKKLKCWLTPKRVWPTMMTLGTQSSTRYEPRGRCLIIAPWHYPLTFSNLFVQTCHIPCPFLQVEANRQSGR